MKKITLLSTLLVTAAILGASTQANAEKVETEVSGQKGSTRTTVTVKDQGSETDPLDPEDPTQTHLTLESVPSNYNFDTTVSNKNYTIGAALTDQNIVVFNDRVKRNWSVKATLEDNQIKRGSDVFPVSSFIVNEAQLVGTGVTGIVAQAKDDATKNAQNNTGNISTPINELKIAFSDSKNVIKVKDTLEGKVTYQLYATMGAE